MTTLDLIEYDILSLTENVSKPYDVHLFRIEDKCRSNSCIIYNSLTLRVSSSGQYFFRIYIGYYTEWKHIV